MDKNTLSLGFMSMDLKIKTPGKEALRERATAAPKVPSD